MIIIMAVTLFLNLFSMIKHRKRKDKIAFEIKNSPINVESRRTNKIMPLRKIHTKKSPQNIPNHRLQQINSKTHFNPKIR